MRFVLSLALCYFVLIFFSVLLALRLPRLGKRELILVLSYVCSVCACLVLSVSSSSSSLGRAAACSLANYSVAYEEIQSNQVSDFRDFVCSLFPKAILFDFYFYL